MMRSKLPETDLEKRCVELKDENRQLRDQMKSINDACKELQLKLSRHETVQNEFDQLETENKTLRERNESLSEEIDMLRSKLPEKDLDERCVELREENSRYVNKISRLLTQRKIEPRTRAATIEDAQRNFKERYVRLEAERERAIQEKQQLREKISKTLHKLSVESCWEKKQRR
ncbi:hypothetical protein WMY93_030316 [Mugilogobius chulae]|uniref:Uncharacterized protein n=1 Tax=Mugilogobius chulae TaxID=88201 RepID=A0AAW0MF85_9GOBI